MSKGNVLLIFPDLDNPLYLFGTRVRPYSPPLGPLYLAAQLQRGGYNVKVVDFSAEKYSKRKLVAKLQEADVVGITALSYARKNFFTIIADIRSLNPTIPIMIGGPDCTAEASALGIPPKLPDGVDAMAVGDAEHTVVTLVDFLLSRSSGSSCRLGSLCHSQMELDEIPFPDRNFANRSLYTLFGKRFAGVVASIITSRGCPYKCKFCNRTNHKKRVEGLWLSGKFAILPTFHETFNPYRERSAGNVLDEIEKLFMAGYKVLYIVDDNFMVNEKRVHAIMDGILARKIKMAILAQGRVYPCSEELYGKMKEAGVHLLSYGLESGNQDVLDFYRKGTTIEQAWRAVELADRFGIFTHANFILGAPIETPSHIERTIKFAMELPLDAAFFNVLNYTYGSSLWDDAFEKGLISQFELDVLADKERGLGEFPSSQLAKICRQANYRFFLRPTLWRRYLSKLRGCEPFFSKLLLRGFLRFWADVILRSHNFGF